MTVKKKKKKRARLKPGQLVTVKHGLLFYNEGTDRRHISEDKAYSRLEVIFPCDKDWAATEIADGHATLIAPPGGAVMFMSYVREFCGKTVTCACCGQRVLDKRKITKNRLEKGNLKKKIRWGSSYYLIMAGGQMYLMPSDRKLLLD